VLVARRGVCERAAAIVPLPPTTCALRAFTSAVAGKKEELKLGDVLYAVRRDPRKVARVQVGPHSAWDASVSSARLMSGHQTRISPAFAAGLMLLPVCTQELVHNQEQITSARRALKEEEVPGLE
jgi:hypothetical protein